ncbi:unnamed protein product [Nesidiocoris tenuis]|uniref:Uncharacterized protein n=1 Tax=Nesidiocoris tenuis TaxID=355587 RepID=A0A6H5FXB9_9HEMI|nr:unnamed protein product [Nesidiocoris tenuis]
MNSRRSTGRTSTSDTTSSKVSIPTKSKTRRNCSLRSKRTMKGIRKCWSGRNSKPSVNRPVRPRRQLRANSTSTIQLPNMMMQHQYRLYLRVSLKNIPSRMTVKIPIHPCELRGIKLSSLDFTNGSSINECGPHSTALPDRLSFFALTIYNTRFSFFLYQDSSQSLGAVQGSQPSEDGILTNRRKVMEKIASENRRKRPVSAIVELESSSKTQLFNLVLKLNSHGLLRDQSQLRDQNQLRVQTQLRVQAQLRDQTQLRVQTHIRDQSQLRRQSQLRVQTQLRAQTQLRDQIQLRVQTQLRDQSQLRRQSQLRDQTQL